jgi:hypothetical protein
MSTDPNNGSTTVIAPLMEGGTRSMRKLSPGDFVALANFIAEPRRKALEANAQAAGYTGKELFERLNDFDSRPVLRADVVEAANEPRVQIEIFRRSLAKDKPDATDTDVDALGLDLQYSYRLALALMHISISVKPPPEPAKGANGSPLPEGAKVPSTENRGSAIPSASSSPKPTESELVSA